MKTENHRKALAEQEDGMLLIAFSDTTAQVGISVFAQDKIRWKMSHYYLLTSTETKLI